MLLTPSLAPSVGASVSLAPPLALTRAASVPIFAGANASNLGVSV